MNFIIIIFEWNFVTVLNSCRKIFKILQRKDIKEKVLLGRPGYLEKHTQICNDYK